VTPDTSAAIAALAAAAAAVASAFSAWYSRKETKQERNEIDCGFCVQVIEDLAGAERKVRDAADQDQKDFEFRNLFNLMEALASLVNDKRVPATTLKIVENYLKEAWAWLRGDEKLTELMMASVTGSDTYIELRKFAERRHLNIEGLTNWYHGSRGEAA
jgi:hypothetical protein